MKTFISFIKESNLSSLNSDLVSHTPVTDGVPIKSDPTVQKNLITKRNISKNIKIDDNDSDNETDTGTQGINPELPPKSSIQPFKGILPKQKINPTPNVPVVKTNSQDTIAAS